MRTSRRERPDPRVQPRATAGQYHALSTPDSRPMARVNVRYLVAGIR
jgi:hypothetical protein